MNFSRSCLPSIFLFIAATVAVRAATTISLPDLLAIELPDPGQSNILGSAAPMSNLLASATTTNGLIVTCDRANYLFPPGGTRTIWTAWTGEPQLSPVAAAKTNYVFVFRHGQTPIGASGDPYATAGNHGTSIARDASGALHVAWLDTGWNIDGTARGNTIRYRRGTQDPDTGIVTWNIPVDVSSGTTEWYSYVKLSATSNAVHFAWPGRTAGGSSDQNNGLVHYRRLVHSGGTWQFDPIQILTNVYGGNRDNGLDIAAFSDSEVHVLTRHRIYAYTTNAAVSNTWVAETLTPPSGLLGEKYPALAVDSRGDVHVAYTALFRTPGDGLGDYNNYWKVWYMHRKRPGNSQTWVESHDINAQWPEWQDPGPGTSGSVTDVVGDWMDIACDSDNTVHIGWHGTAVSHYAGKDDAWYSCRPVTREGDTNGWTRPQRLHRHEDDPSGNGLEYSWTPSFCCADRGGVVIPVIMYKALGLVEADDPPNSYQYYNDMDSLARVLQHGRFADGGTPLALSQAAAAGEGIAAWWPNASRKVYFDANGRAWLDILTSMDCSWVFNPTYNYYYDDGIRTYVVHQRVDVSAFMPSDITVAELRPGSQYALTWNGPTNKIYRIQTATSLTNDFTDLLITTSPSLFKWNSQTATVDQAEQRFFQVMADP